MKNGAASSREAPAMSRVQRYWPNAFAVLGCSGTWRDLANFVRRIVCGAASAPGGENYV
jgi:hypothetical protein